MMFGNGGIVGNGKAIALCFFDDDFIYLLKNPRLNSYSISMSNNIKNYIDMSGVKQAVDFGNSYFDFDLSLRGYDVEILKNEPGLIQRLMTEDLTTRQMVRLVREKIEKRRIK